MVGQCFQPAHGGLGVIGFLLIILVVASWQVWSSPKDPAIDGRKLSDLIREATNYDGDDQDGRQSAVDKIFRLGAKAVPYFGYELSRPDSIEDRLSRLAERAGFNSVADWLTKRAPRPTRQHLALAGLDIVGTNALGALPEVRALGLSGDEAALGAVFQLLIKSCGPAGKQEALRLMRDAESKKPGMEMFLLIGWGRDIARIPEGGARIPQIATNAPVPDRALLGGLVEIKGNRALVRGLLESYLTNSPPMAQISLLTEIVNSPEWIEEMEQPLRSLTNSHPVFSMTVSNFLNDYRLVRPGNSN